MAIELYNDGKHVCLISSDMVSNKVCKFWVNMVRGMEVDMLVPQHGRWLKGPEAIDVFLDWIENLHCGIDLFSQDNYKLPV